MKETLRASLIDALVALGLVWVLERLLFPTPRPADVTVIEVFPVRDRADDQDVN